MLNLSSLNETKIRQEISQILHDAFGWAFTKDRALFEWIFAKDERISFIFHPKSSKFPLL